MIEYRTNDTPRAAYLCCLPSVDFSGSIKRADGRIEFGFAFSSVDSMETILADYEAGNALVDPLELNKKRDTLMAIIHAFKKEDK